MRSCRSASLENRIQRARTLPVMNIGIDLGTTNSALAYIDPAEAAEADFPPIHVLPIEQQVDASNKAKLRTLPSFLVFE